jgi:hypothetical protein
MPEFEPPYNLPAALADVLERAVGRSVATLAHLRVCVIDYSAQQSSRGVPLEDVSDSVERFLTTAEDDAATSENRRTQRDAELARQVRAWCDDGYNRKKVKKEK